MEVQLTDFENAAFTVFVVLVTRVILAFDLALYIPLSKVSTAPMHKTFFIGNDFNFYLTMPVFILPAFLILPVDLILPVPLILPVTSQVDENMHRAHQRDAIHTQKFFFRKHMAPPPSTGSSATGKSTSGISNRDEVRARKCCMHAQYICVYSVVIT